MTQDAELQRAVLAELGWDPRVTAAHIGVAARAGIVTLTGHVESFAERHAAEAAALRVRGVHAVADDIEVRLAFERQRGDDDIAAAVLERLAWDVSVPARRIAVSVAAGWVTLTGEVDWFHEKRAAEEDVRRLVGVIGISDQIVVRPRVDAPLISDEIMHALGRSWFFDEKTIQVTAIDGHVRLTGSVHTPHERQVAAETAWAAAGTIAVANDIVVR